MAQDPGRTRGSSKKKETHNRRTARSVVLVATAVVVLVGAGIAIRLATRGDASPEGASVATKASATGAPAAAPAATVPGQVDLEKAADAVGFHQTVAANVGVVENLPANTPMLTPSGTLLPVGIMAPDFTLSTPDGKAVRLSDYRGRTILLEFFASWCPHCQAEAQHLLRLYQGLSPATYAFLSVNADGEDAASVHAFGRFFKIPWPELLDPGTPAGSFRQAGGPGHVTQAYGIGLYPTFFIIDRAGKIAWRSDREQPDSLLLQQLQHASGS